jgi:hypothetical protein
MGYDRESQEFKDLCAAYALLEGIDARDSSGLPRQEYLSEGSEDEKAARTSIARLLASDQPLDGLLRRLLAGLFDNSFCFSTRPSPDGIKFPADRLITFTRQSRRNVEHNRRLFLGFEMLTAMGFPKDLDNVPRGVQAKALREIRSKYNVTDRTAREALQYVRKAGWAP